MEWNSFTYFAHKYPLTLLRLSTNPSLVDAGLGCADHIQCRVNGMFKDSQMAEQVRAHFSMVLHRGGTDTATVCFAEQ